MAQSLFIDIAEKELRTYLFDFRGGQYSLKEMKKYTLSEKIEFSLDTTPDEIETTYLSLPISRLNFRIIDLPFSDKERIREILPFELDGMILGGSDRVVFDNVIVGASENKHQVLAVYTEKNSIKEILDKLKLYGIDPVFITCLELRNRLSDFSLPKLLSPVLLDEKERIALSLEEIKKPAINLRRGEFVYTKDIDKTKKSLRVTTILAILLVSVLSAGVLLNVFSVRSEIASVKNDIRKNYQEIFPGEKNILNELYQLKSRMKELKSKEDVFLGIHPLELLLKLSQTDKQGIVFHEITADKVNITLKGEAPSLSEVQKVKDKLGSLFDEVTISDSKSSAQDRVLFTITAKEKRV